MRRVSTEFISHARRQMRSQDKAVREKPSVVVLESHGNLADPRFREHLRSAAINACYVPAEFIQCGVCHTPRPPVLFFSGQPFLLPGHLAATDGHWTCQADTTPNAVHSTW